MRYLAIVFILAALFAFGLYGYSKNLPKDYSAQVHATYHQPIEKVWERVSAFEHMPEWFPEVAKIERLEDQDGFPVWRLYPKKGGSMDIELIRSEEPKLHISKIVNNDKLPFGGTWTFQLKPVGDVATEVTLTEDGYIKKPLMRLVFRYAIGYDAMIKKHLEEIGSSFGEKTEVTP